MVMPVTHHDSSDRVRDASDPLPTITGANRANWPASSPSSAREKAKRLACTTLRSRRQRSAHPDG